jgi:hypothetical protein
MNYNYFSGIIHLHTIYSKDSDLTPLQILNYAKRFNVDFVIITDHNTIEAKKYEGYYGNTLLLVGEEISPPNGNHLLAIGIDEHIEHSLNPQENIDKIKNFNGLSFIEHPFFNGNRYIKKETKMMWQDWNVKNFTGMSIFNYTCDGGERMKPSTYLIFYFFPGLDKDIPNYKTIKKWDELTQKRRIVGIGTLDAHFLYVKIFNKIKLQTFPFIYYFNSIRTIIITDDKKINKESIHNSLKNGHAYINHEYLGDGIGFIFGVEKGNEFFLMGDKVKFDGNENIFVKTPKNCLIRIIKNGQKLFENEGNEIYIKNVENGIYRVETEIYHRFNYKPWIFSNPIYILREKEYEEFL